MERPFDFGTVQFGQYEICGRVAKFSTLPIILSRYSKIFFLYKEAKRQITKPYTNLLFSYISYDISVYRYFESTYWWYRYSNSIFVSNQISERPSTTINHNEVSSTVHTHLDKSLELKKFLYRNLLADLLVLLKSNHPEILQDFFLKENPHVSQEFLFRLFFILLFFLKFYENILQ